MSRRVLVTGAGRGIGLEYARQWLAAGARVFALARDPEGSAELMRLASGNPDALVAVRCDVADDASVAAARRRVGEETDGLEILINNAGVMGSHEDLESLDLDVVRRTFEVNAIGPIRVTRAFVDLLMGGKRPRRIVNMTSLMGSIDDNRSGDAYAYRMSKAALNMATRSMAVDLSRDGVVAVVLHPGWVRTAMGGKSAPTPVEEAVASLVRTIESLDMDRSGGFYDRDGQPLPW
ncbi:MAG TPA: SDR family oxidoreductase [Gemmatimonadota bacterium]|nr:SDR family oxidoreductase [Gemmatimonadota bacterium]